MGIIKRGIDNQAMGLLPLLLFMFLDNFFSYLLSFIIAVAFCLVSIISYQLLRKDKIYQLMLLPSAGAFALYSIFMSLQLEGMLLFYSSLIVEIMLVVSLACISFSRRLVLQHIRDSKEPGFARTYKRTALNEFYFVAQITQSLFTLHLFAILIYSLLPMELRHEATGRFLYREAGILIGVGMILYEQVRLMMMSGSLKKEMWLPVLNDKGHVIGCMARSVSRTLPKKYCHPVVRVALVYNGMLYLVKRNNNEYVSPDTLDYPFRSYVLFHHSIDETIVKCIGPLADDKTIVPRFLIRYVMEDEKVKHMVSLYVICLRNEGQFNLCKREGGKLWSAKQIEDDLKSGIFSEYFLKEFSYVKNTILLAESFCCEKWTPQNPQHEQIDSDTAEGNLALTTIGKSQG